MIFIFYCQSCSTEHTMPHVTSANITSCAKCGSQHFATWKPCVVPDAVRLTWGRHQVCPDENGRCFFGPEDKCPAFADRAEPGAQVKLGKETIAEFIASQRSLEPEEHAAIDEVLRVEHKPEHAAERDNRVPEAMSETRSAPASAAPEVAAPQESVTAAAPDVDEMVEKLRNWAARRGPVSAGQRLSRVSDLLEAAALLESLSFAHARGRAEGLEEAAKIACKACLDEFCKFEELLPESFTLNQMEEMVEASIQIAIRAKIKPGSWKEEM